MSAIRRAQRKRKKELEQSSTYRHDDAANRNIWTQPFPYPSTLPEDAKNANLLVSQSVCFFFKSKGVLIENHDDGEPQKKKNGPIFVPVHDTGEDVVSVSTRAY